MPLLRQSCIFLLVLLREFALSSFPRVPCRPSEFALQALHLTPFAKAHAKFRTALLRRRDCRAPHAPASSYSEYLREMDRHAKCAARDPSLAPNPACVPPPPPEIRGCAEIVRDSTSAAPQ